MIALQKTKLTSRSDMKTYLQMDGDKLVEYVEKREYDEAKSELSKLYDLLKVANQTSATMDMKSIRLESEVRALKLALHDAVKRMEAVNWESWADVPSTHAALEGLHSELIQAAKGEQP